MPRLSDAEIATLREKLSPEEDAIAFAEATEYAFSHPLYTEKRPGEYHCTVCGEFLFAANDKYDSGSGWPSFSQVARQGAVETKEDLKLALPRTEVHCANCGAHLGHVFPDGPGPDGLRYCINGNVLDFRPEQD